MDTRFMVDKLNEISFKVFLFKIEESKTFYFKHLLSNFNRGILS